MAVDLPYRPDDENVKDATRGGDLLDGEGLVDT